MMAHDLHRMNAARMFKVAPSAVTPDQRAAAKRAAFRAMYYQHPYSERIPPRNNRCGVKGTPLHREVSKVMDPRRALRELRKVVRVYTRRGVLLGCRDISEAFVWVSAPQGQRFWQEAWERQAGLHSHK